MHNKRVLFLTSMLPARGRHGGRQAVYNHLRNLAEAKEPISIDLVVVDIDSSGEILPSDIAVDNYWIFDREFPSWREKGGKIAEYFTLKMRLKIFGPKSV